MVPWAHPTPQPKRQLNHFSRSAGLTSVTDSDRPTDHTAWSVTIGCTYVHSTAMQCNNAYPHTRFMLILYKQFRHYYVFTSLSERLKHLVNYSFKLAHRTSSNSIKVRNHLN